MTLGEKIKEMRKRFGFSQEQLASLIHVSRQAITKWETDNGLPDIANLQELAKLFNVSVDSLLSSDGIEGSLKMKTELDKEQYPNKLAMYEMVLKDYFKDDDIYVLTRSKKMTMMESTLDLLSAPIIRPIASASKLSDLSPYYLVLKNNKKYLVNIKQYVLEVIELADDTDTKRFIYEGNVFTNSGRLKLKED